MAMDAPYPMLWFDDQALPAAELYTSLLPNSAITQVERYPAGVPGQRAGEVMTVAFTLDGAPFTALNGGPHFRFSEAISFVVPCADQAEIDHLWEALTTDGGAESRCGWLVDRFGLSWQIIPRNLAELISHPAAMQAMLGMTKLVIADLTAAADA
jgi:predicted 3-demethylubiquinone-9 3-methyltransferase (glyoxalase superfamily)